MIPGYRVRPDLAVRRESPSVASEWREVIKRIQLVSTSFPLVGFLRLACISIVCACATKAVRARPMAGREGPHAAGVRRKAERELLAGSRALLSGGRDSTKAGRVARGGQHAVHVSHRVARAMTWEAAHKSVQVVRRDLVLPVPVLKATECR